MYSKGTTLKILKADGGKLSKSVSRRMRQHIRQSARIFIKSFKGPIGSGGIPVWTGEAKSSLLPLASALRVRKHVHIVPSAFEKKWDKSTKKWVDDKSKPIEAANWEQGDYQLPGPNARRNFVFSFTTYVPHFATLDTQNVSNTEQYKDKLKHPTPWKGIQIAMDAFSAEMNRRLAQQINIELRDDKGIYELQILELTEAESVL